MADKIGTLEYEMLINEEKLTKQLQEIDKLLKVQDEKWKKALSNVGSGSLGNIDTSKLITANKAIETSTVQIKTKISELKKELKQNIATYENYSEAQRKNTTYAAKTLSNIQEQKNELNKLGQSYREQILIERELLRERNRQAAAANKITKLQSITSTAPDEIARLRAVNKELEYKRTLTNDKSKLDSLNREIVANQRLITAKKEESKVSEKLIAQAAQRQKQQIIVNSSPAGSVEELKQQIKYLEILRRQSTNKVEQSDLTRQINEEKVRRDQLVTTLRQEKAQRNANLQQEKLQAAVNAQQVGSIGRLRAEYALYAFQLGQVGKAIPYSTDKIRELTAAMAENKQQINALKPTQNMWGKLTSAIRTYVTAYLSVQAAIGLGRSVFRQTKELDQLAFSMQTVIQNSTELAKTQKFLSDVAINYGGDLLTLSERYIKFRAAAIQSNVTAAETQKIFDSVSKAAGTLGLKTDELSGVYLALEQMLSKGKVTTEELRRQLGERLPGAFGIMATALGVTIPELDKMLKKGEVLSTEALPKFAAALEKAYGIESLKKIDTLAAAQGRMSTQFTELIRSMNASDAFKSTINAIADFLGFIRSNISTIGFFAKAIFVVAGAMTLWRMEQYLLNKAILLGNAVKAKYTALTVKQTAATIGFKTAAQQAATAQNSAAAATSRWSLAFKTFGGWIGIIVNILITAVGYFAIFGRKSKEVAEESVEFSKQLILAQKNIDNLFDSMSKSTEGSNVFETAIAKINFELAKYNLELITSKSSVDELTDAHEQLNIAIVEGMITKQRSFELDKAAGELAATEGEILSETTKLGLLPEDQIATSFAFMRDLAKDASMDATEKMETFVERFGEANYSYFKKRQLVKFFSDLSTATNNYYDTLADINKRLPEIVNPDVLDISGLKDELKAAKEEFDKIAEIGADKIAGDLIYFDKEKGIKNYEDYLNSLLEIYEAQAPKMMDFKEFNFTLDPQLDLEQRQRAYKKYTDAIIDSDKERAKAREQIYLELASLEEGGGDKSAERLLKKRNEAINELNKKYLQDREDFVNADLGITAGRIAAMESGIEKEEELNKLSYANRLRAIDKERDAALKLINEIAGTENKPLITGLDFDVSNYSQEVQSKMAELIEIDNKKRANAAIEFAEKRFSIEEEYSDKVKELRRDVSDEFLKGVEKEKAAIKEKYDAWEKQAKAADPGNQELIDFINSQREVANTEIDRRFELDKLDFFKEIEYKKNEIALGASLNRRKLDKANFDTYVKYQKEKIRILRESNLGDSQTLADRAEEELLNEQGLENTRVKSELQDEIIAGARKLNSILAERLGLSQEEAAVLTGIEDVLLNLIKGNYIGAAVGAAGTLLAAIGNNKEEDPTIKALENINELLKTQSAILANLSDTNYFELAKKQYEDLGVAIDLNTDKLKQNVTYSAAEYQRLEGIWKKNTQGISWETFLEASSSQGLIEKLDTIGWTPQDFIDAYTSGSAVLDEQQIEWVKEITRLQKERVELLQETFRQTLGFDAQTVSDDIFTGINEGLKLSENGLGDFSQNFGEMMKKALMQGIMEAMNVRITEDFLTQYREYLSETSEGGKTLTDNEKKALEEAYISIVQQAEIDSANIAAITDKYTSQDPSEISGLTGAIQSVTEDTARRLEGLINSIRETSVNNMNDTSAIMQSNEAIKGYASQSLGHLSTIDSNIALQLALFNDLMSASSVTGKSGLRVVVQ